MISSQVNNNVYEALFRQAVIDNFNQQLDSFTLDDYPEEQYTYSPEHEKRMNALFTKEEREDKLRAAVKWSRRAAAVILIAISVLFGSLILVPEVRAAVIRTVIEWYDQFARFPSAPTDIEKTNLEPAYIPDGFWEDFRDGNELTDIIFYTNGDGIDIIFHSSLTSAQTSVNNEGYDYEVRQINGIDYHVFTGVEIGKGNFIVWEADGQRYSIGSLISIDELQKMALSVGK